MLRGGGSLQLRESRLVEGKKFFNSREERAAKSSRRVWVAKNPDLGWLFLVGRALISTVTDWP